MLVAMKNFFSEIGFVNLYTKNKKKTIRFYRDILRMKPQQNQSEESSWYGFKTSGSTFAIEPMSNRDRHNYQGLNPQNNVLIQFLVHSLDDLEQATQHLESKGITITTRLKVTDYGTFTNFLDPDGNLVELLLPPKER